MGGIILSDPVKYNDVFLGRPNREYVDWIMKDDSWGGMKLMRDMGRCVCEEGVGVLVESHPY